MKSFTSLILSQFAVIKCRLQHFLSQIVSVFLFGLFLQCLRPPDLSPRDFFTKKSTLLRTSATVPPQKN